MELAQTIILVIAACLAVGLFALLVMPFSFRTQGSLFDSVASGWITVGWAFGALQLRAQSKKGVRLFILGVPVHRFDLKMPSRIQKTFKTKKKKSKPKTINQVGSVWQKRTTLSWIIKRLFATLHLTGQLKGRLGLGDPADMAWLAVLLMQIESRVERFRWAVEIDYTEEIIDLNGKVQAWLVPGHMLWVGLTLMLRRDVRIALKT